MSVTRARAVGCGHYLPARVVTNEELAARIDTTDEWIRTRTGIRRRHVAAEAEVEEQAVPGVARVEERAEPRVRAPARLVRDDRRLPPRGDAAQRRGGDAGPAEHE